MTLLLVVMLLYNTRLSEPTSKELYQSSLDILLKATVPQVFLATMASGERYVFSPTNSHESLYMFVAGLDVIDKRNLLSERYEVKLLMDLARNVYKTNSDEMKNGNEEYRSTAHVNDHIEILREKKRTFSGAWSQRPEEFQKVTVNTAIACINYEWELNYAEVSEIFDYMSQHEAEFLVPKCAACEKYRDWIIQEFETAKSDLEARKTFNRINYSDHQLTSL
jgi:hypothetical protein